MVTRLITETKEIKPEKYTEQDYEQAVQRLKQNYPKIGRRIYKTSSKSWKQVYEEMLDIIEKEKWTPKLKPKT
jgi:L-lactate utilization protein LutC